MESRNFTDQKQRIVTERDLELSWNGAPKAKKFGCYLCSKKFQLGDKWRWSFGKETINFMVCDKCDSPRVRIKFRNLYRKVNKYFWLDRD